MRRKLKGMAIECQAIVKAFGTPPLEILKSLTFQVPVGHFVSITGRSGSGKSTLLYVSSGLDSLTSGQAYLMGEEIHRMLPDRLNQFRNQRMGFVFQFHYLLPELTALENILMPARKLQKERERRDHALQLMKRFDLHGLENKLPSRMSGGEQQRVAIARALIMDPDILFADEPTGNLDSVNSEGVLQILEDFHKNHGTTILMVTHDEGFANRAQLRIHLKDGQISSIEGH